MLCFAILGRDVGNSSNVSGRTLAQSASDQAGHMLGVCFIIFSGPKTFANGTKSLVLQKTLLVMHIEYMGSKLFTFKHFGAL